MLALWLTTGLLARAETPPPALIDTGGSGNAARRLARQRQKQRREAWEEEERRLAAIAAQARAQAASAAPVKPRPPAAVASTVPDPSGAVDALRDLATRQARLDAQRIEAERMAAALRKAIEEEEDDFAFILMA